MLVWYTLGNKYTEYKWHHRLTHARQTRIFAYFAVLKIDIYIEKVLRSQPQLAGMETKVNTKTFKLLALLIQ